MSRDNGATGAQLMLAFLAGAVTGAAVAFLATPQTGAQTRESLRGWAHDAQDKAGRVPNAMRHAFSRASAAAREAFTDALRREAESSTETS